MMEVRKKKTLIYVIIAFVVGMAVSGAGTMLVFKGALGYVSMPADKYREMADTYSKYQKLEGLYQYIDANYYQDIKEEDLINGACKGLVSGLDDPYSSYMTATEYDSWKASATGNYSGIGVTFTQDDKGYVIVGVTEKSPAHDAGLKAGDYILKIDGKEYDDMDVMAAAIRGKKGTKVKVTYYRDGNQKDVTLVRADIVQESVTSRMIDDDTGYIGISSFLENTAEDFHKALKGIEDKGAKNLVLDLRDNGGGLVDSSVDIADEFLDKGVVTYTEDKNGKKIEYKSKDGRTDLKTVVLVNENSASASEILAAALKDNGFKTVGQNTFGKGVIQSTVELKDGSALKLTIMQYFSPDGHKVHKKGVKPDYAVKNSDDSKEDAQLDKALSLF